MEQQEVELQEVELPGVGLEPTLWLWEEVGQDVLWATLGKAEQVQEPLQLWPGDHNHFVPSTGSRNGSWSRELIRARHIGYRRHLSTS